MHDTKQKIYNKRLYWLVLIGVLVVLKLLAINAGSAERFYTYGLYPVISTPLRVLLGWLPFSIGDILYGLTTAWLIYVLVKGIGALVRRRATRKGCKAAMVKTVFILLCVVVAFYLFWGENYSRQGIAVQLKLEEKQYSLQDLDTLTALLQKKLNAEAPKVVVAERETLKDKKILFAGGIEAYRLSQKTYPFLNYKVASIKPSLFSYLGNYMGFQGYYNPFTGEAQVNTTCPVFVQPFVLNHEMAHQLGYAKENEANFVGYLTGKDHPSIHFRYAVYFSMYQYAIGELYAGDSLRAKQYLDSVHPLVRKDLKDYRLFYQKYRNRIEPVIRWLYGNYLKANKQPQGNHTYDEVATWLIAYYKRYGKERI